MSEQERFLLNEAIVNIFARYSYYYAEQEAKQEELIEKVRGWDEYRALDDESKTFLKEALGNDFKEMQQAKLFDAMSREQVDNITSGLRQANTTEINSGKCCLHCKYFAQRIATKQTKSNLQDRCTYHREVSVLGPPEDVETAMLLRIYPRNTSDICNYFIFSKPEDYLNHKKLNHE